MRNRIPRCIVIDYVRCPRKAAKRNSDLFVCTRHGLIAMAILDDWLSPFTRRMLAFARWETARQGQGLIDARCGGRR